MNTSLHDKIKLYSILICFLTIIQSFAIQAQPFNDDCVDAAEIIISDNNYGLGVFTSDIVSVEGATVETGTYFLDASPHDRDIWFSFYLPTARYGKLELFQEQPVNSAASLGFITYLTQSTLCPPPESWVEPAKLTPVPQQGSTDTECLDPGYYLVQVTLAPDAIGAVYLELTLGMPFENVPGQTPVYDEPSTSTSIFNQFVFFDVGCHTVESDAEFDCLPSASPEELNQSLWFRFQGGAFPEYIGIEFILNSNASAQILPEELGLRLFEGSVQNNDWTTLPVIGECRLMTPVPGENRMYAEFRCENIPANSTISMALFFPGGYVNNGVAVKICKRGGFKTGGTKPILSELSASNIMGVLPSSSFGITSFVVDTFTCGSSLTLAENQCGSVNPPDFVSVTLGANTYELEYVTWVDFELENDSEVKFSFNIERDYRFLKLYNKEITNNCNNINAVGDLYDSFKETKIIPCVPAGKYALQILGGRPNDTNWQCSGDNLGHRFKLFIRVRDEITINHFALDDANAYERINDLNPLVPNSTYVLENDTFGCEQSVIINGGTCEDRTKLMLREFIVNEEGVVVLSDLTTGGTYDFHHKLYKGSISDLAAAQNAYQPDDVILNAQEHVEGCIEATSIGNSNFYCVTPGQYSLATFGGEEQRGFSIGPSIQFKNWTTDFDDPNNPDDLGDLTDIPEVFTSVDTFSCGNNGLTIAGVAPCGDSVPVVQIYRVFYLSAPRIVEFISQGAIPFNLFKGNIADGINTLIPWSGDNVGNDPWELCRSLQRTSDCDMLTEGYYTLVSYGRAPSFQNPFLVTTAGEKGNLGQPTSFQLNIYPPKEVKCNLPSKTCFANNGELADWDHSVLDQLCPQATRTIYVMDTVFLNCVPDTPFSNHPITACAADDNRVAYYGFKISDVSSVKLSNIPYEMEVKIYDFDATLTPNLLMTEEPVYPCMTLGLDYRLFCNVQPGTYTIVIFAKEEHRGNRIVPVLQVEQVVPSRFDHWANAYDFGMVPGDGVAIFGKPGDVNPLNDQLPPSTDYLSCSTSGSPSDPLDGACCIEYNPLIGDEPFNIQTTLTQPPNQQGSLRNIIYTFMLQGSGECEIKVSNCIDDNPYARPNFAIYKADSGAVPFEVLQQSGGIDSTYADGLELVDIAAFLSNGCDTICMPPRADSLSFDKTACTENESRYYLVVSATAYGDLNQQISVSIEYEEYPTIGVQFDEFEEAGSAVSDLTGPDPYTLMNGNNVGQPMSFQCATTHPTDLLITGCDPEHTVWYRFQSEDGGRLLLGYGEPQLSSSVNSTPYLKLYQAGTPNTVANLTEVPLEDFPTSDPQNSTGSNWTRGCIAPGDYYLFWAACGDTLDIFSLYEPVLRFESHPGDYCYNAVPIDLVGEGTAFNSLTVDCHTIGTELLDGPDGYDCLLGPEGYKSSFFVLNLIGPTKRDVTFSMSENTTADFSQIRYRVLPGYCGAATPGLCSTDPNTSFTLNCLAEGSYIIQVVTADFAEGNITFTVDAVNSPDQDCIPLDPLVPNAFFTYSACEGDTIYFENQSTFGEDMIYEWTFPDYSTAERSPDYYFPRPLEQTYITVSLQATNTATGASDFVTLEVEISPIVEPIIEASALLCENGTVNLTASNFHFFAQYDWSDGQNGDTIAVSVPGVYFVSVTNVRCPQYDSIEVIDVYCDSLYLEACDSVDYRSTLIYDPGFFTDTLSGSPDKDTLRAVTVVINSIEEVILDPAFLDIEIGDEIELNVYTTANDPMYTWSPFDLLEFLREDKVRAIPIRNTTISVLVEDSDGCLRAATTEVRVAAVYNDVFIPNVFSPNGDGVNDYFHPFGAEHIVRVVDFRVFDRWGGTVFQNSDFALNDWQAGWDGQVGGKDVGVGVYAYFAKVEYLDGAVVIFEGDVVVMR